MEKVGGGGGGGSLPKPATEDCQPCPHTPRTHTAPHTRTETERQRRSSWAELPLRPSPPAFTGSRTTWLGLPQLPDCTELPALPAPTLGPIHAVRPSLWQHPESLRPGLVTCMPLKARSMPALHSFNTLEFTDSFSVVSSQGSRLTQTSHSTP